jgi:hypothetical protein
MGIKFLIAFCAIGIVSCLAKAVFLLADPIFVSVESSWAEPFKG